MTSTIRPFSSNAITLQAVRAAAEARIPVMLVGAPGVGKTATIREMAKTMGYKLITLLGSQMDPTDITGLPKGEIIGDNADGDPIWATVYLSPWWQAEIMRKKKVILFLDEFSNTSSAVRASMLTLLQNREFPNGEKMPEETIVLGAMNPTEQAADGWELDKPTTNRLLFLTWKSSNKEWAEGMLNAWGEEVSAEEMTWRRLVVKFLDENPSWIHKENSDSGSPEAFGINVSDASELEVLRYAWASRRSWDNLTRVLARVEKNEVMLQDEIASGLVGRAASNELRQWLMKNSVISPKDVLKNPKSVDWATIDVSEGNIILREIVEIIDEKSWRQALKLLEVIADEKCYAIVGSYLVDIFRKVIAGARVEGKVDEAKAEAAKIMPRYKNAGVQ